jgi:hypothetical protein
MCCIKYAIPFKIGMKNETAETSYPSRFIVNFGFHFEISSQTCGFPLISLYNAAGQNEPGFYGSNPFADACGVLYRW